MNMQDLCEWANAARNDTTFSSLRMRLQTDHITSPAALLAAIEAFQPEQGWLACQSGNLFFRDGAWPQQRPGQLHDAELYRTQGDSSLHLRYRGDGSWLLTYYLPDQGEEYVSDELSLLGRAELCARLAYQRLWAHDPRHGLYQFAARFVGFKESN